MQVWDTANQAFIRYEASDVGQPHIGHVVENSRLQARVPVHMHALDSVRQTPSLVTEVGRKAPQMEQPERV